MWWKTLKSDQSDLFSRTHTHIRIHIYTHTKVYCYLWVFLCLRFLKNTIMQWHHQSASRKAAITFCLSSLSPGLICPASAPPAPLLKHLKNAGGAHQTWPRHPYTKAQIQSSHIPPPPLPHLPLFHTRYAEESAERPCLITVVHPSGTNTLRKVNFIALYCIFIKYPTVTVSYLEFLNFFSVNSKLFSFHNYIKI